MRDKRFNLRVLQTVLEHIKEQAKYLKEKHPDKDTAVRCIHVETSANIVRNALDKISDDLDKLDRIKLPKSNWVKLSDVPDLSDVAPQLPPTPDDHIHPTNKCRAKLAKLVRKSSKKKSKK